MFASGVSGAPQTSISETASSTLARRLIASPCFLRVRTFRRRTSKLTLWTGEAGGVERAQADVGANHDDLFACRRQLGWPLNCADTRSPHQRDRWVRLRSLAERDGCANSGPSGPEKSGAMRRCERRGVEIATPRDRRSRLPDGSSCVTTRGVEQSESATREVLLRLQLSREANASAQRFAGS